MSPTLPCGSPPPAYNYLPIHSFENTALRDELDEVEVLSGPRLGSPTAGFEAGSLTDTDEEILGMGTVALFSRPRIIPYIPPTQSTPRAPAPATPQSQSLTPTPQPRITKRQKAPIPTTVETPPLTTFEMLLHVLQPDRKVWTLQRKTKVEKVEPRKVGPVNLTVDMNWEAFLTVIVQELGTVSPCLVTTSFEWHFLKPANSPKLLLSSSQGLQSMVNQVNAKLQKEKTAYVTPWMPEPSARVAPPAQGPHAPVPVDEDIDSNDDRRPLLKKAKLDDVLEGIVVKLDDMYPPGLCMLHPNIACFEYRVGKLHFELTRARKLNWAVAIRGGSGYDKIPLGNSLFRADQVLKVPKAPTAEAPAPPAPATAPAPHAYGQPMPPFNPYQPYPMPMPGYYPHAPPMGYGGGMMPWQHPPPPPMHPQYAPPAPHDEDPPSLLAILQCELHEFCKLSGLNDVDEARLEHLGFRVGDNLTDLAEDHWTTAGFKPLDVTRVKTAY